MSHSNRIPQEITRTAKIKTSIIHAHASTLPNDHDEDRFSLIHDTHSTKQFGFAVFDGHGGSYGSILCGEQFVGNVFTEIASKVALLKEVYPTVDIDGDIYDTILSESIYKVTIEMNRIIKAESATGTTFTGLFIRVGDDGTCYVYCANVGDSRAILHYQKMTAALSEDHNLTLEREKKRINEHQTAPWSTLSTELKFPVSASRHLTSKPISLTFTPPSSERLKLARDLATFMNMTKAAFLDQSDDIEMLLISMETMDQDDDILDEDFDSSVHSQLLSGNYSAPPGNGIQPSLSLKDISMHGGGGLSPSGGVSSRGLQHSDSTRGSGSNRNINGSTGSNSGRLNREDSDLDKSGNRKKYYTPRDDGSEKLQSLEADAEFVTMQARLNMTIVAPRKNAAGKPVGPVALMSRQGVSIMMTRSIGDRNAARTCVCVPDITRITLPKNEYARLIIGTDGMWDVMPNELAMSVALKHPDPAAASAVVVKRARLMREEAPMRIDDITCVVVDINPHGGASAASLKATHATATTAGSSAEGTREEVGEGGCACTIA